MKGDKGKAKFESAKSELSDKLKHESAAATQSLHDARDEVTRKASQYASAAKDALFEEAEGTQRDLSANMAAFGGALRAASEHLANNDQRTASKFVLDAAGGLERIASSLNNKPFEHVLEEVRDFGRENSGALIAGSVLAGLALGRFIKSASPAPTGEDNNEESNTTPENHQPFGQSSGPTSFPPSVDEEQVGSAREFQP
jgi:hypothetical protein